MAMGSLTPEQEEAMAQRFRESQARTEAMVNRRRFEDGKFALDMVKSPDEPGGRDSVFQQELHHFSSSLHAAGIPFSQSAIALDAVGAQGFPLPEFVLAIKTLGPPMISAIAGYAAAWAQGRSGRKVRIKIGEIEVEAHSVQEVERLLEKVASFESCHDGESS